MDFIRHPTARRYVIRVRSDGSVRVTVPRWGSRRQAELFAEEQRPWIERQRARVRESATHGRVTAGRDQELRRQAARELPGRLLRLAETPRGRSVARERPESTLALGILFAFRSHLPELATRADARQRPRLCADSRADASETARSLSSFLAPRCPRVPRLRKRTPVAPRTQTPAQPHVLPSHSSAILPIPIHSTQPTSGRWSDPYRFSSWSVPCAPTCAGTKEHVVEDAKAKTVAVHRGGVALNNCSRKRAASSSRPCHVLRSAPTTSGPSGSCAAADFSCLSRIHGVQNRRSRFSPPRASR